jgi:hypothetical protein
LLTVLKRSEDQAFITARRYREADVAKWLEECSRPGGRLR